MRAELSVKRYHSRPWVCLLQQVEDERVDPIPYSGLRAAAVLVQVYVRTLHVALVSPVRWLRGSVGEDYR